MSKKYPLTPTITSPKGIEKHVQAMQTRIAATLTWLDYCFAIADKEIVEKEGREIIRPIVYQGKNADLMPLIGTDGNNDFLKSYCFFDVSDPITPNFGERAGNYKYAHYKVEMAIIFWVNLERIENTDYRLTKSKLRIDIMNMVSRKFKEQCFFMPTASYEKTLQDVFKGYTVNETTPRHPYWGFRVEGDFFFKEDCYVTNTYTR